jgi:uncharacterized protein (AIM24 family)
MIKTNLLTDTSAHKVTQQLGCFSVIEYTKDISVTPSAAQTAYFCSEMGVRKRQVAASLNGNAVIIQSGAMQWFAGNIEAATDIKGAGDLMKKMFSSKVTGETAIKPKYGGTGLLVLEPTYKYILLEDLSQWGGNLVIEDGLFLACNDTVQLSVTARSNLSSAVLGGEGLFNTCLKGNGIAVLESPVPHDELVVIDLENDTVKIDGNYAIAWSAGLQLTVERTTKTLVGSATSGEGLVNVYRGTGRVLMAPVRSDYSVPVPTK